MNSLVQPLFGGPLDIVGDVHGEIEALRSLLDHLGYEDGRHPEGRRLVFLGDLTDRGPDSLAVVDLVQQLINSGQAQCVLGNHDLNILLGHGKQDNHWFFGESWSLDNTGGPTPAALVDDSARQRVLGLFTSLPLVLERSDLRVVHACWDDSMVELARRAKDVLALYEEHCLVIDDKHKTSRLDENDEVDKIMKGLEHQNRNPVKRLTSGPEEYVEGGFVDSSGKRRYGKRVPWWKDYPTEPHPRCVFGHYSILPEGNRQASNAICADFGVTRRWAERKQTPLMPFRGLLGAVRIPDNCVVFDNGGNVPLVSRS